MWSGLEGALGSADFPFNGRELGCNVYTTLVGDMGNHSWTSCEAPRRCRPSYHPHAFKGEDSRAKEQQESLPVCNQGQVAVVWGLKKRKGVGFSRGGHLGLCLLTETV